MYESDDKGLTCLTCGNRVVTVKSHDFFCRGFERGPWLAMSITPERLEYWKSSPLFKKWADKNNMGV